MKKGYNLTTKEISLIEIADILIAFWIVGLLLVYFPVKTASFFGEWRWAFFALAIIFGIVPVYKMIYGEKSLEKRANDKVKKKKRKK